MQTDFYTIHTKLRYAKFVWRSVVIFNLALGAYIYTIPVKKVTSLSEKTPTSKDGTITSKSSAQVETPNIDLGGTEGYADI